jgi:hypothetical protein
MAITRRTALRTLAAAAIGAATGAGAHGALYERHRIRLATPSILVSGLPPALSGLRLGVLTDLHHGRFVPREDLDRAVELVLGAQPDLITLLGDFINWGERGYIESCADAMGRLRAPHGVFAVPGNHDEPQEVPRALSARGIEVLQDARTTMSIRGERVDLAGVRFWTKKVEELATILRGAAPTTILLAHDPRRLQEASLLDVPLVLSGHTHGGQVVLPLLGALAARRYPVVAGVGVRGNTRIFVSRGVGTVFVPVRINCPPEVAVVTLRSRWEGAGD